MFRELRRKDRELNEKEIQEVLKNNKYGVMSLFGENGYPYGVPIHYTMIDDSIYFHCSSRGGHKIEALEKNSKISFTVIETEDGIKSKSVIGFGNAIQAQNMREIVLEKMVEKFVPDIGWKHAKKGIPHALDNIFAFEIKLDHLSGKWIDKPEGR